jgi:FkbM family methyltransferase
MSSQAFVSYAQNHEDVVLARALHPDMRPGFWIDVGAADPLSDSVTAAFAERGWRGVNVEPVRAEYERLCEMRPTDDNLCLALGDTPGHGKLFVGPPGNHGASTLLPELAERYRVEGSDFTPVEVAISTLREIVEAHVSDPVDFLKIDVEGSEGDVLAGADWSNLRPRIVVIDSISPVSMLSTHEDWEWILIQADYRFALFDGINRFYARSDEPGLIEALSAPANALDGFTPYVWSHQVQALEHEVQILRDELARLEEEAARASEAARYARDETAIATEHNLVLRDDLAAAQLRGAKALADLNTLNAEVEKVQTMRVYRHAKSLKRSYEKWRRVFQFLAD